MADIKINLPDCTSDDGDGGERGERGKRGKRGHRGPTGPTGPAGAPGGGGLLKFSGVAAPGVEGIVVSYLADTGVGVGLVPVIATPPDYPVAIARSLVNFATNVLETVSIDGVLTITLLKNGVAVPGFVTTYTGGQTGIKTALAGPVAYAIGDTFDVEVSSNTIAIPLDVSATVGVV